MYLNDEQKKIINEFNDLMPWNKEELILYLVENNLDASQEEKLCKDLGYVNYDDLDFVKEVCDNDLQEDVLDEMDDYDILNYLLNSSFDGNSADNLKDWMERMYCDDVADALAKLNESDKKHILNSLYNNYPSKVVDMLKYFIDKLNNEP